MKIYSVSKKVFENQRDSKKVKINAVIVGA